MTEKPFNMSFLSRIFLPIMTTDDSFGLEKKRSGTFFSSNSAEDKIALTIFPIPCHLQGCHFGPFGTFARTKWFLKFEEKIYIFWQNLTKILWNIQNLFQLLWKKIFESAYGQIWPFNFFNLATLAAICASVFKWCHGAEEGRK